MTAHFGDGISLAALTLDHVTAIAADAFYGCTGLETLEIPKCTRFDSYFVSGCSSLTRIEATAAGNFVDIDNENDHIERSAVFHNRTSAHSGANAFDPAKCDLVLNADKREGGGGCSHCLRRQRMDYGAVRRPHEMEEDHLRSTVIRAFPEVNRNNVIQ